MATRHYTTKDFFRQIPNGLLARYFHERVLFADLDFAAMKETKPDALFAAWLELDEAVRNPMDAVFREIFDMSCKKGFKAIIDEARWQFQTQGTLEKFEPFVDALSELPNHYHRSMVTFLDHNDCWKGATRFYHADTLSYWRKRKHLGHEAAAVNDASILQLSDLIGDYFHHTHGTGRNCLVEPFRRGDLDYFFAYPEDHSQQSPEWVNGEFDNRPHNPAFEVVFVYSQKEGSLDLNFRGTYKAVEPLWAIFAQAILKLDELPPDPKDKRVYNLNSLQQGFDPVFDLASGISDVAIKKLRLSSKVKHGDKIILEADTTTNSNAVYDLMEKIGKSIKLHQYNVTQVEIAASLVVDADKPPKPVIIRITHPNSCSLKYDEQDLKLREMLEASGIEPKEAEEATEA
ncbi:MAG: hypothetical protein KZQ91_12640 [Candidatus Thiodiazotropha sp. (ex Lucinoma borealis)]|nr:hypothetical protein [Candidatus Thiodiazotropha sp. (ex Lucinoma borealis)]